MGEHDALGLAGGARSIDQGGQILRLDGETAQPLLHIDCGRGILQQRREGDCRAFQARDGVHDDDVFQLCAAANGSNLAILGLGRNHRDASARIDQQGGDLLGCERGIDGHIGRAQHQGSEVHHWPLPAILRQQRDAVALDDAP